MCKEKQKSPKRRSGERRGRVDRDLLAGCWRVCVATCGDPVTSPMTSCGRWVRCKVDKWFESCRIRTASSRRRTNTDHVRNSAISTVKRRKQGRVKTIGCIIENYVCTVKDSKDYRMFERAALACYTLMSSSIILSLVHFWLKTYLF